MTHGTATMPDLPEQLQEHPLLFNEILTLSRRQTFVPDTPLFWEGDRCAVIPLVSAGTIRVYKGSESGREITLYEVAAGETCILTISSILGNQTYPANAVTVTDGEMLLLPAEEFIRMMNCYEPLRMFVFNILNKRFTGIMELIHEVAFGKMNERLWIYLSEHAKESVVCLTHQKIANDLGTSREVISRLLKDFELRGQVSLSRNMISIIE